MENKAELTLAFSKENEAQIVHQVLRGETFADGRTRTELSQKGRMVHVTIQATNSVALRAAVNTYLRHAGAMETLEEVV